jgi:hypothetical protein
MNRTVHDIEPEEVMAYLDGELEASRASEVAVHISACTECATVAADLRSVSAKLMSWEPEKAPSTVSEAIQRATKDGTRGDKLKPAKPRFSVPILSSLHRPWKIALAFGGAVAVIAVSGFFYLAFGPSSFETASRQYAVAQLVSPSTPPASRASKELSSVTEALDTNAPTRQGIAGGRVDTDEAEAKPAAVPMIARTAAMNLVVAKLDPARALLEKMLARHHGFASQMTLDKSNDAAPSLDATLQVPSAELDAVLGELRGLGRVTTESQGGEDVSDQHVDLAARLHNEREAEQRLIEILRTRTGKLSDVVEVEEQISLTRGEIEQMEAQLANLDKRVAYASIKLQIAEEYKAPAATGNGSVGLRLRNAIVGGYRDAVESLIGIVAFFLNAGPMMLLWGFILFWPARALWKRRGFLRTAFGKS